MWGEVGHSIVPTHSSLSKRGASGPLTKRNYNLKIHLCLATNKPKNCNKYPETFIIVRQLLKKTSKVKVVYNSLEIIFRFRLN